MRTNQFRSLLVALPSLSLRQLEDLRKAIEAQHQRLQSGLSRELRPEHFVISGLGRQLINT